jgi:hypothetical protein
MNNVMGSLIDRNAVEIVTEYEYGNLNMALYGRKKKLKEMCDELKKYEIKDFILIDRLFPKNAKTFIIVQIPHNMTAEGTILA